MKKKKAMVEVHFNWIFILIAGAVIFVFFINIVNKQRQFSEIKTSGTIVTNLESILTGAQVSTSTVNIIDMPRADIGFECERFFVGSIPQQTKGNVIFSPSLLKGKKLITWALDWNLPYRITNFLYLTDPQLRYIIVDNAEGLGQKLAEELPEEMNIRVVVVGENLDDLINKNNYKVKFIFFKNGDLFNEGLLKFIKMNNKDVTAINLRDLETSNIITSTGTIDFYQKDGNGWGSKSTTYYLKKQSLFGAIFASDIDMYNCVIKKAFKKLNLVSTIYQERSTQLNAEYGTLPCSTPHGDALPDLGNIESSAEDQSKDFDTATKAEMDAIIGYSSNIKAANQRAQLLSCALIY